MLYVVAYDIRDNRRLSAVAKVCRRYGVRVGLSVFEAHFKCPEDYQHFLRELEQRIEPTSDLIRIYRICENCVRERTVLGLSSGENLPRANGEAFIF